MSNIPVHPWGWLSPCLFAPIFWQLTALKERRPTVTWREGWRGRFVVLLLPLLPGLTCHQVESPKTKGLCQEIKKKAPRWSLQWRSPPSDRVFNEWRSRKRRGTSRRDTQSCARSAPGRTGQFGEFTLREGEFKETDKLLSNRFRNTGHALIEYDIYSCNHVVVNSEDFFQGFSMYNNRPYVLVFVCLFFAKVQIFGLRLIGVKCKYFIIIPGILPEKLCFWCCFVSGRRCLLLLFTISMPPCLDPLWLSISCLHLCSLHSGPSLCCTQTKRPNYADICSQKHYCLPEARQRVNACLLIAQESPPST